MVQSLDDARRNRSSGTRVPPHDLGAEASLLGAMLLSSNAIGAAAEVRLTAADFYKPSHGHIYEAIESLYHRGDPADPVTVADELNRDGLLEAVGGKPYLVELQAGTPAISNAARYARIVEEFSLLRRLIGVAGEIAELGYSMPDDVSQVIDRAETLVFEVNQNRIADDMIPVKDLLAEALDKLEALYDRGEAVTGVPTGFHDLDHQLAGLQPNNLVVVGARPAMGKTSFALGILAHAAMEANVPTLLFSLEMGRDEITQRLLTSEARVDASKLKTGRFDDRDWQKVTQAVGRLAEAPIFIDDNPNVTVMDIRAKARRLKAREGLGLLIIDYMQLMTGRARAESRQVEVAEISRGLKILARELQIPVVALSQLSRQLESRQDKRPLLSDLRESGCLTANSRVLRADTGAEVTMGELLLTGERDIPVWSLDEGMRIVPATMTHVFPSGIKEVFALRLASGRVVEASANHPFRTVAGWTRLDELAAGTRVAVPAALPQSLATANWAEAEIVMLAHLLGAGSVTHGAPVRYTADDDANLHAVERAAAHFGVTAVRVPHGDWCDLRLGDDGAIQSWLAGFGLDGLRSDQKFLPRALFSLADEQLATFLRHLWSTSGVVRAPKKPRQATKVLFATNSERLAFDVQTALLRFHVGSRVVAVTNAEGGALYEVVVERADDQLRFCERIGVHGSGAAVVERMAGTLRTSHVGRSAPHVRESSSFQHHPAALATVAEAEVAAEPGVFWDTVVAVEPLGAQPVYDATVLGTHNFIANGICVHNSLEQDADVVMFLYRDEMYNPESADKGAAEVIVAKHRNGPTGVAHLAFLSHYTRFADMARSP